jgi:hypothetical protein
MVAALTYARRHALFTLVGIAGEDDLDAPDLAAPTNLASVTRKSSGDSTGEVHRFGDEAAWWRNAGVDPTISARALWLASHPLPAPAEERGPMFEVGSSDQPAHTKCADCRLGDANARGFGR